jgi:predicted amino acid-binding ACT domain protein
MNYEISTTDVWSGDVDESPGALAALLEALEAAGASLDFVVVRPSANVMSGRSLVFVAPLTTAQQTGAAARIGLAPGLHALRVVGPDQPGIVARITRTLANSEIPISGVWAAVFGGGVAVYLVLESGADARRAAKLLSAKLTSQNADWVSP